MPSQFAKSIAAIAQNDEERLLLVRTEELFSRAESGAVSASDFLNLGEQYLCRRFLAVCGKREGIDYILYGGYAYAERRMLFCLPDYLSETAAGTEDAEQRAAMTEASCEEESVLSAVRVVGSGYKTLGHRDYLGALLSLGVERRVLGDIAVSGPAEAVIICKSAMLPFFMTDLERIGADKVHVTAVSPEERRILPDTRQYAPVSDTVASLRLDAVTAALANLPRDKAKQLVSGGFVELDFRTVTSPDETVPDGAYVSVRGVGRFLFLGTDGSSKKGRIRIRAKKFI